MPADPVSRMAHRLRACSPGDPLRWQEQRPGSSGAAYLLPVEQGALYRSTMDVGQQRCSACGFWGSTYGSTLWSGSNGSLGTVVRCARNAYMLTHRSYRANSNSHSRCTMRDSLRYILICSVRTRGGRPDGPGQRLSRLDIRQGIVQRRRCICPGHAPVRDRLPLPRHRSPSADRRSHHLHIGTTGLGSRYQESSIWVLPYATSSA